MSKKHYLYHMVPPDMKGRILYPLNRLKDIHPGIFGKEVVKYKGREHITKQCIPPLDCLWNDVLHMSAVHPQNIHEALRHAGFRGFSKKSFFVIDAKTLDLEKLLIFLYEHETLRKNVEAVKKGEGFKLFSLDAITRFSGLPQATVDYYKRTKAEGKLPLGWHRVPHFLYKGTIDVSAVDLIVVE